MKKIGYTITASQSQSREFNLATIAIFDISPFNNKGTQKKPVTLWDKEWTSRDLEIEVRWQSSASNFDGWYGGRCSVNATSPSDIARASKILRNNLALTNFYFDEVLTALQSSGSLRVSYLSRFSHYVAYDDLFEAAQWRVYCDHGIQEGGCCTVHAYVRKDDNNEHAAQDSVAAELRRNSAYCNDQQFASWVGAGRKVREIYSEFDNDALPEVTIEDLRAGKVPQKPSPFRR